jgi:hypothetical protein
MRGNGNDDNGDDDGGNGEDNNGFFPSRDSLVLGTTWRGIEEPISALKNFLRICS